MPGQDIYSFPRIEDPQGCYCVAKKIPLWKRSYKIISTTVSVLVLFVQCSPPRALWDQVPVAKCWNANVNLNIQIINAGMYIEACQPKIINFGRADQSLNKDGTLFSTLL